MKTKILELIDKKIEQYPYEDDDTGMDLHSEHNKFRRTLQELRQEIEEMEDMIYTINKECDRNEMPNNPEDLRKFLNDNGEKQYPTIDPINMTTLHSVAGGTAEDEEELTQEQLDEWRLMQDLLGY